MKRSLWRLKTLRNQSRFDPDLWITLSICRIFKRLYRKSP
jgi:hypothetical protein